ncbi:MAG: hypothetical protein GXP05_08010 [Alphaproteobacteria bacterium]|nr:hypothetical protein [Alphaproteobacteria bacterium]
MRINEKMGLVYTALFLTVSVALITQNSDALMAAFRGESNVKAVDDIFTVRAGREQRLFVLNNDVNAKKLPPQALALVSQPSCGLVKKIGSSFVYKSSPSCVGHQTFTYSLDTGARKVFASVVLRLTGTRDPIDSVASGPETELTNLDAQASINGSNLEITNVYLGKSASTEATLMRKSSAKLAKIAIEQPLRVNRPEPAAKLAKVAGDFTMSSASAFGGQMQEVAEVSADILASAPTMTDSTMTDSTLTGQSNSPLAADLAAVLPHDPANSVAAVLPQNNAANLTERMVRADAGFKIPSVMPGIDNSPFGTKCLTELSTRPVSGGMVELTLNLPCLPNTRVEIRHAKLTIAVKTGHSGTLTQIIPAFEKSAHFSVQLPDGRVLMSSVNVPDLENIDRIAVQWRGNYSIALHALEFGASQKSSGHVWFGAPSDYKHADKYGRGYSVQLGDSSVQNPIQAQVYSLIQANNTKSGVIELVVAVRATAANCGKSQVLRSFRSKGGLMVGASGLQFKMPDCGDKAQSIVLKNAVRDLIIAAR